MDQKRGSRAVFVLLSTVILAAMLNGCGSSKETMPPAAGTVLSASTPTAGLDNCVSCHTAAAADWITSKHANLDPEGNMYSAGVPTLGQMSGTCTNCHDPSGDSGNLSFGYTGNIARPVIGCESCHGSGSLHVNDGGSGPISLLSNTTGTTFGTVEVSGQFAMCTACHELLDSFGTGTVTATHAIASSVSPTGNQYSITDTHFAMPGDWSGGANSKAITGYAMNYNNERVCVNCHNPHKAATQNREWAQSGHGDTNPFNLNSTKTGYFSGAWAHYNWSQRPSCQRCHTTTGFAAYADALKSGNTALAEAINSGTLASSPVTSTEAWKPEMLQCNGCHVNNRGDLRNPGAITANYNYGAYAIASHAYPDLGKSNVCMACHTGRESGDTVKGLNDPALLSQGTITTFNFDNMGFINSHYLTAGGQVFAVTGYEFDGRPYNNIDEFRHDKIGTAATRELSPYVDTGTDGPCVGCHMSRPNGNGDHLFMPVSRSTSTTEIGEVTGIASEICFKCHGPSTTLILDLVKEQKHQYHAALEALEDQLEIRLKYYFAPYHPYFFTAPYVAGYIEDGTTCAENLPIKNWDTGGTTDFSPTGSSCSSAVLTAGIPGTGKNNMGAAFNYNVLEHDPGAYVHNRMYTKRLIYDSIDWVDDGEMNYSVGATLNQLDLVTHPYKAEAILYLLPNGELGIEAERP